MSKFNKTIAALDHFSSDKNVTHAKVFCMGMKGSGKTLFREMCFNKFGEERDKNEKWGDLESKRNRAEMMPRTCATFEDRNYVDIAYKRFESEDYEWEEKKVKMHFSEPNIDFRMEKEVSSIFSHVDCLAIFIDSTTTNVDDFDLNICLPFLRKCDSLPPLVLVYNSKGKSEKSVDRSKLRNYIGYDSLVASMDKQILEVDVKDLKNVEDVEAIANACLRQGTLQRALAMPKPNPRIVLQG